MFSKYLNKEDIEECSKIEKQACITSLRFF